MPVLVAQPARRHRLAAVFIVALVAAGSVTPIQSGAATAPVLSRVSTATDGTQANDDSDPARSICPKAPNPCAPNELVDVTDLTRMSGDGRLVAFSSEATNLVPGDTNGASDIFLH